MAGLAQLRPHPVRADLVELVERDEHRPGACRLEAAVGHHRGEHPSVVDPHREVLQAEGGQGFGGGEDQLDLGDLRRDPEHVDVALGELSIAAVLWPFRPPHRPDLDGLEGLGQARVVVGVVADQGHGEVEAQGQVGEILGTLGALELLATLQDLEDQLFVLAAFAAQQQAEALDRGGLDAHEAVAAVHRQDLGHRPVAERRLLGQHVAHAAGRRGVKPGFARQGRPTPAGPS